MGGEGNWECIQFGSGGPKGNAFSLTLLVPALVSPGTLSLCLQAAAEREGTAPTEAPSAQKARAKR